MMLWGLEFQPPDGPHICQGKGRHIGYDTDNIDNWKICGKPAPHFCHLRPNHGFVPEPVLRQGGMYLCEKGMRNLQVLLARENDKSPVHFLFQVEHGHIPVWSYG
ncbi:MAG: hypothetical protein Q7N87_03775 [Candidatus Uhrbacteria bacterium]|nr:hypothetical protein [Candidatus Uhrbacteria bacterium]